MDSKLNQLLVAAGFDTPEAKANALDCSIGALYKWSNRSAGAFDKRNSLPGPSRRNRLKEVLKLESWLDAFPFG